MEYKFDTNFKVGEILYTLINNKITEVRIEKIKVDIIITDRNKLIMNVYYTIILNDYTHNYLGYCPEKDLYKTKEELINNL